MSPDTIERILEWLGVQAFKSGSQVICDPAPKDSDHDYFVLNRMWDYRTPEDLWGRSYTLDFILRVLFKFERCSLEEYESKDFNFISYRNGKVNVIVLYDRMEYAQTLLATRIAKKRNLLDKEDRVKLFEDVRKGLVDKEGNPVPQRKVNQVKWHEVHDKLWDGMNWTVVASIPASSGHKVKEKNRGPERSKNVGRWRGQFDF